MKYILITKEGRVMTFYIEALAKEYQIAYGGTLMNDTVENESELVEA